MGIEDENLPERYPRCSTMMDTHEGVEAIQDLITWYSRGEISAASMRLTYDGEGLTTYHLAFTRKKK